MKKDIRLIAGLGNPGGKYIHTWHNLGFMAVEYLSQQYKIPVNKIKFKGLYGKGEILGEKVILLKPTTYMNLSGESVAQAARYFDIPESKILLLYDDIDIEKGKVRIRGKGGAGTHNGMRSVIMCLGNDNFPRIRIGSGPLPEHREITEYVLSEIPKEDRECVFSGIESACSAAGVLISEGISKAMNEYNGNSPSNGEKKESKDR